MYFVVVFVCDKSVAIVHSNWLVNDKKARWPKSSTFQVYQRLLLEGSKLEDSVPNYEFHEVYHSGKLGISPAHNMKLGEYVQPSLVQ
ncbi:hypothetical protein FGIG_07561 [Fasciola gigantica]|uniref:Uncharacterized protein n=1 Tax=Fasciola gigantica TaxID=46835 RepID=A0A504YR10_FASGI|nr:hypothetical protein FGIG_07561 [Fasciola gigantica]